MFSVALLLIIGLACGGTGAPDEDRYPALRALIDTTPAIDVHSHPQSAHRDYSDRDIYPVLLPPISRPFWPTDPGRVAVWETRQAAALAAIYGFSPDRTVIVRDDIPQLEERLRAFWAAGARVGLNRVLDQCGIDITFANRSAPLQGVDEERVRWVPFADPLFTPFDPVSLEDAPAELLDGLAGEYEELVRLRNELGIQPATLGEHLGLIQSTLERFRETGAVAVKVESAYHRSLRFTFVTRADAERLYQLGLQGKLSHAADYLRLQDFLARAVFRAAGKVGLPVHLHTGFGATATLKNLDSHPLNLEEVLSSMEFADTTFVLLHAGYPYWRELKPLLEKKNVYVEISAANWMVFEGELAQILYEWFTYPGAARKVMFGADAGAPVFYHIAASVSREALYRALERMITDSILDERGAGEIALDLLRRTAMRIHGLTEPER